jgi:polyisoprenyl-teichoic acid--peptidoglycan teichoic acid transferase
MSAPRGEKPYRVYRGGRVKGKVPAIPRPTRERGANGDGRTDYRGPGAKRPRTGWRAWGWKRWTGIGVLVLILVLFFWMLAAYLSFRSGVKDANKRLPASVRLALTPDKGMILSHPTDILLLGTDHSLNASRAFDQHSDSIQILRTDPKHHKLVYLSIPRDLRVPDIPGHGPDKINAAFQIGGARLAARTVHEYTGLPINHIVVVNFHSFAQLIDKVGGIDLYVPENILSNKFDCPYSTNARCDRWKGWRFHRGKQHMNGYRALIYSRIRENQLNARDTDITRAARQQAVVQALMSKLSGAGTFFRLPFIGGDLMKPLATDLTPTEMVQLGWLKFRSGSTLHCRLGGNADGGYIDPSEDNRQVILMVRGESAPQPPPPNGDTYPPGCYVNRLPPGG